MTKGDTGGWKVEEATQPAALVDEAPPLPEASAPRRRLWPFGRRPKAPVA